AYTRSNWGFALNQQAKEAAGAEADELYRRADEKFATAYALAPRDNVVLGNWAVSLIQRAGRRDGAEGRKLLEAAEQKLAASLEVNPDDHMDLYTMACLRSLMNDVDGCLRWLTRRASVKPPLSMDSLLDSDF